MTCHLVVVDNHSDDGTQQIALELADSLVVAGPERSTQRNRGARSTDTGLVGFIDSDMVLEPGVLAEAVTLLSEGAGSVIVPESSFGTGFWARVVAFERDFYARHATAGVEAPRFFRRVVFELAGGFDESMLGGEDWDLGRRARGIAPSARTQAGIRHDEGHARFRELTRAKAAYAGGLKRFVARYGAPGVGALSDRPYLRRPWLLLAPHPLLGAGLVSLKTAQSAAVAWSLLPRDTLVDYIRLAARMPGTIGNWPVVLGRILVDRIGLRRGGILTWVTPGGSRLRVPNNGVARGGLFEVFVTDVYRLEPLLAGLDGAELSVLDLGAHVGEFVVAVAERGRLGRAACYEPTASSARFLRRNLVANHLDDRVEVYQEAIGAADGEALLYEPAESSCESSLAPVPGVEGVPVQVTSLATALGRFPGRVDILKVDIEGAELEAVTAAPPDAVAQVVAAVIEYHPSTGDSRALIQNWMRDAGFRQRSWLPLREHGILTFDRPAGGSGAARLPPRQAFVPPRESAIDARKAASLVTGSRRVFSNWLSLTALVGLDRIGIRSGRPLRFVTRAGTHFVTPNNPIARAGTYEVFIRDVYGLSEAIPQLPARPLAVIDLGAQVGNFVLRLAELDRLGRAVCYEPSPLSHRLLMDNLAENHLGPLVECRGQAVAPRAGTYLFEENSEGSGSTTMLDLPGANASFEAEAVTLTEAIDSFGEPIDLAKVNIEGIEYELFAATPPEALRKVGSWLLEHHNVVGCSWEDIRERLVRAGFELRSHRELWHGGGIMFLVRVD